MPLVSVIIPTYKHRDYVLQTLASVFAQTFTDYEVIVVNDGSPDDTAEVLRPLAETGRIRCIAQANAGQAAARNRGIAEAQGEYIALLDDDDLWPPDKLEWQTALLSANPDAAVVYGCTETFGGGDKTIIPAEGGPDGQVDVAFLEQNWIISPGQALIRAANLKQIGLLDTAIWGADDWDLFIRLSQSGKFVYRHKVCLNYRFHAQNASGNTWLMYVNCRRVQHKHLKVVSPAEYLRRWVRCRRATVRNYYPLMVRSAQRSMEGGDYRKARRLWMQSLHLKPATLGQTFFWKQILKSYLPGLALKYSSK